MDKRADYEVGTLESKVEMQVNDAVKSIDTLVGSLKNLKTVLNDTIGSTKNNKTKDNFDKTAKAINSIKKAMNFGAMYVGLKKGWEIVKDISGQYINMIETNNLFEVSLGKVVDQYGNLDEAQSKYYIKAMAFQDEMNEKLATNKTELKEYQAMYFSMLKSQGIDLDSSYLMSESLTKAGYDIASLYNLTVDDAMSKLRSGLAGQVEPLRKIGVDISESSLQKVLDDVGIERSVQQLSYAEKEVARYIAIIKQAGQAQGDFAKTFESPANQIRVFKNQLIELKQVAGSFIVNAFGNIITHANAIIMVIKEILKAFANLFGYDLNASGTNLTESTGITDLTNGLGSASKKAKELKKQLMGFDEINNISAPTDSSGGAGSGGAGGIDSKLLENLKEWDNKMSGISGKAQEIRDKMLEWLGFKRNDKGGWELESGLTNFEKIKDVVGLIGTAIATWKVSRTVTNILEKLDILKKGNGFKYAFGFTLALSGLYLLYKGVKHLLDGEINETSIIETLLGAGGLSLGIATMLKTGGYVKDLKGGLKIGFGITLALTGLYMEYNSVKKMLEGDISLGTILQGTGSAFLIGIGAWLLTGNPMVGLITTAGVLAFNLGVEIGMILNEVDWAGIWKKITDACSTAWGYVEDFFTEAVPNWWNEHIAPWFTKEKWKELGENIKSSLSNKWTEFKDWWGNTAIVQWWSNNVSPWFTKEKWKELGQNAKSGIENKFNSWKQNFNIAKDWYNDNIKPWFTWEKWKNLGKDAIDGLKNSFKNFKLPDIKLPHFEITYETNGVIAEAFKKMGLQGRPKLNVNWYANGGMPDMGEIFVARERGPELVGKIGNKTAVANNGQIVDAVKQGVYEAVVSAMSGGQNTVSLDIRADEGIIVRKASEGFKEYVRQTGELPFPIPV